MSAPFTHLTPAGVPGHFGPIAPQGTGFAPPRETIKVIRDILVEEMGLVGDGPNSQVMLSYERFDIPAVGGIYMALNYLDAKATANNNYAIPLGPSPSDPVQEIQQVVMLYHIQIDIMSFDSSARLRKEEIFQALRSLRAQAKMETYNIQIARMPSVMVDASSLEESKMLNRFTVTIAVSALLTKVVAVPNYYNDFPFQFDENDSGKSPILNPEDAHE